MSLELRRDISVYLPGTNGNFTVNTANTGDDIRPIVEFTDRTEEICLDLEEKQQIKRMLRQELEEIKKNPHRGLLIELLDEICDENSEYHQLRKKNQSNGEFDWSEAALNAMEGVLSPLIAMRKHPFETLAGIAVLGGVTAVCPAAGIGLTEALTGMYMAKSVLDAGEGTYNLASGLITGDYDAAEKAVGQIAEGITGIAITNTGKFTKTAAANEAAQTAPLRYKKIGETPITLENGQIETADILILESLPADVLPAVQNNNPFLKPAAAITPVHVLNEIKKPLELPHTPVLLPGNKTSEYGLTDEALEAGASYLAEKGTPEYDAVYNTAKESFVVIKDKSSAMQIFKKQFSSIDTQNSDIIILNPSDPAKAAKHINTSNAYMCGWFAQAAGLEGKTACTETLQDMVSQCSSKKLSIIVPDDCAVTGNSLVMNTIKNLNKLNVPDDTEIQLVFSPMIQSDTAQGVFKALSELNFDALKEADILSKTDGSYEAIEQFFSKYRGRIKISAAQGGIITKPYYRTEYYKNLQAENPELAQAVDALLTDNGTAAGFGRKGQNGVMIASPSADGVTLKCPNNNPAGAAPFALAMGAEPETIKRPCTSKTAKKWQFMLKNIKAELKKPAD